MKKTFLKILFLTLFINFFLIILLTKVRADVVITPPIQANSVEEIIEKVINYVFTIALILAPLMVVVGGIYILSAGGDPNKVKKGGDVIKWAVIGLGIVLFSRGIMELIKQILT
jgi:hypothetical protein